MVDALSDYGALVAPTAAVINGFIAVLFANFFKDRPVAKVIFVAAVGLLGVAAVAATFYNQHLIVAKQAATDQRNKGIRETLGSFIGEGQNLIAPGCATPGVAPPIAEFRAWQSRIITFLDSRLGHSYVERLSNLPPGFSTGVRCNNASVDFNQIVRMVIEINTHLEQFSQQVSF